MKRPMFSVCIPTRNRVDILETNIKCLLRQTNTDFEVHISDNGSNNLCKEIFDKLVGEDIRFHYYRPERELKQIENFEYVISKAEGDYVILLEDKQFFFPSCMEKCANVILKYHPGQVSFGMCTYVYNDEENSLSGGVYSYVPFKGIREENCLEQVREWLEWENFDAGGEKNSGFGHGTGFIKREFLNIMRQVFGYVFWGWTTETYFEQTWIFAYMGISHYYIDESLVMMLDSKLGAGSKTTSDYDFLRWTWLQMRSKELRDEKLDWCGFIHSNNYYVECWLELAMRKFRNAGMNLMVGGINRGKFLANLNAERYWQRKMKNYSNDIFMRDGIIIERALEQLSDEEKKQYEKKMKKFIYDKDCRYYEQLQDLRDYAYIRGKKIPKPRKGIFYVKQKINNLIKIVYKGSGVGKKIVGFAATNPFEAIVLLGER